MVSGTPASSDSPIHVFHPIIPYCADCNRSWEADPERRLGKRFLCPISPRHVAAFVKGNPGKFWLRIEARILRYEFLTAGLLRGRMTRYKASIMMLARAVIVAVALDISKFAKPERVTACAIGAAVVVDILMNSISVSFISRFPTHALRSVLIVITSFCLTAASFGVFYSSLGHVFNNGEELGRLESVYFSFATITTVGYGDIYPAKGALAPKMLVICELLIGLFFLSVLLATHAAWVSAPPNISEPESYRKIFPDRP